MPINSRPRLRLVPSPSIDGPYDDEPGEPALPMVDGSLALAFPPPQRPSVPLRLVPPAQRDLSVQRGEALPDPRRWTVRLTQAMAEVLAGARPAQQLADVTSLEVLHLLERWAGRLHGGNRFGPATRPRVASVHFSQPVEGVGEACAVVDTGRRRRALAIRIEADRGRWKCTAMAVG
jgi:hypothetical protein